jgi:hypothetical protein
MRVFISWSGELSRQIGEALRNWLPSALQYVKPYFSPADIEKGARWAAEISNELSSSNVCIIILTRDNLNSNWIMFESGAISSTHDKARVCPLIFDLEETDLQGPLSQFQITRFNKEDIRQLFETINAAAGDDRLSAGVLESVFNKWWPDLEREINAIVESHGSKKLRTEVRSDRDLIEEILVLMRNRAQEEIPRQLILAPNIRYGGSIYELFIGTISKIIHDHVLHDTERSEPLSIILRDLLVSLFTKKLPSPLRDAIVEDLDKLVIAVDLKEIEDQRPM